MEDSLYIGAAGAGNLPRDPYPFVYQDSTLAKLHVEDNVKGLHNDTLALPVFEFTPIPWSIGRPLDYTPGNQPVAFDVVFDIDLALADCAVRRYFQDALNDGRALVFVTSLRETTVMGDPAGIPSFFLKDALDADARPGRLRIVLSGGFGDADGDAAVRLEDAPYLAGCLTGPQAGTAELCTCDVFDSDGDADVDLKDYAEFQRLFGLEPMQ
jgi:hypothetical protein